MRAKQYVHMHIQSGIADTGDYERWEGERGIRVEKLPTGYNVHYSGDGCTKSPDSITMQYMHVSNLHLYLLNLLQ